jgi:mRNA interferase MazF
MIRGEVWTASGGKNYAGKPRPVVIVQSSQFAALDSVTVCPFTTDPTDAPLLRLAIAPSNENGLKEASRVMVDKITTVSKAKLGRRIGHIGDADLVRLNRAVLIFLGLAD